MMCHIYGWDKTTALNTQEKKPSNEDGLLQQGICIAKTEIRMEGIQTPVVLKLACNVAVDVSLVYLSVIMEDLTNLLIDGFDIVVHNVTTETGPRYFNLTLKLFLRRSYHARRL